MASAPQRRRVVIVSPHFDDVPLSLGESLRSGALAPHHIRVRVAFGRTNWTSWIHPSPSRAPVVSAWRRIEESLAATFFRYRWTAAGWSEVVLRTGILDSSAFVGQGGDLSEEPLVAEMVQWLRRVCSSPSGAVRGGPFGGGTRGSAGDDGPPELILVPAGLGGHVDHLVIAEAAAKLLDRTEIPIGFYEDRPYRAYLSDDQCAARLKSLSPSLEPVITSGQIRRSTQLIARACYLSQMTSYFTEAMDLDQLAGEGETVWLAPKDKPEWLVSSSDG